MFYRYILWQESINILWTPFIICCLSSNCNTYNNNIMSIKFIKINFCLGAMAKVAYFTVYLLFIKLIPFKFLPNWNNCKLLSSSYINYKSRSKKSLLCSVKINLTRKLGERIWWRRVSDHKVKHKFLIKHIELNFFLMISGSREH